VQPPLVWQTLAMSHSPLLPAGWTEHKIDGVPCAMNCGQRGMESRPAERGLVVLPDHDGLATGLERIDRAFSSPTWCAAMPMVPHCWWSDRPCGSFSSGSALAWLRQSLRPWLVGELSDAAPPPALVGIESGGQGALRIAYRFPDDFPVVAAICPAIDFHDCLSGRSPSAEYRHSVGRLYDSEESARQDTATLHIHPLNWPRHQWFCCGDESPWWNGSDRLRMKLQSLGVMHQCDLHSPSADESAYRTQMMRHAIDFVAERLEQEQRRL